MTRTAVLTLCFAACEQHRDLVAPPCTYGTSDVRVDGAADAIESVDTLQCVDDEGEIAVAWIDDRDGTPDIWFNASKDGGRTWKTTAVRVNQGAGDDHGAIWRPAIACTDTAVYVAWEDDRDGELLDHNIYLQRSTDLGDTWQTDDLALDDDPDGVGMSEGPVIATADSHVYVAWFDSSNGAPDILMASSADDGASFGVPARVDSDRPGEAYSAWPQIVARQDVVGVVYVVWEDSRNGGDDVYFNKTDNGGASFGTDIRLDGGDVPGSSNSFSPKIAADGDNVYVVWHDARNANAPDGPRDIYANYSLDGGLDWASEASSVESAVDGNKEGFFNSRFPAVTVEGNTAVVAWEDARSGGYDLYARRLVNGQASDPEIRLDGGNLTHPSDFGAANSLGAHIASEGDTVVVLWNDDRSVAASADGFGDLYYNFSQDFGATWNTQDLRVDDVEAGLAFKLDANLDLVRGDLYAAWTDGRAGSSDVYEHVLSVGEEASPAITSAQPCQAPDGAATAP